MLGKVPFFIGAGGRWRGRRGFKGESHHKNWEPWGGSTFLNLKGKKGSNHFLYYIGMCKSANIPQLTSFFQSFPLNGNLKLQSVKPYNKVSCQSPENSAPNSDLCMAHLTKKPPTIAIKS